MSFQVSLGDITFPIAPKKITVTQKSRNRTVDLIDGSQTVIAKRPALREFRMEFLLPRIQYHFAIYDGQFLPPEVYVDTLRGYAHSGKQVELIIKRSRTIDSCVVYIGDMTCSEDAGDGEDIILNLCLVESGEAHAQRNFLASYKVGDGETLRIIARKVWGAEARWEQLYHANETLIEDAARRAGFVDSRVGERLISGIELVIPQEVGQDGKRR